jgi:hypothetical protein
MSTVIYVRTSEGQAAAYDQVSAMPRKLRSILKVIDGKTSSDVYKTSLKAFGDVQGLLVSLINAGLIRPLSSSELAPGATGSVNQSSRAITAPQSAAVSVPSSQAGAPPPAKPHGFEATMAAHSTQAMFAETAMATSKMNSEVSQATQMALGGALQSMSDFVLIHVPQHSFVILNELEDIHSFEQLAVLLGGYEFMVQEAGETGQQHLSYLRAVIKEWM